MDKTNLEDLFFKSLKERIEKNKHLRFYVLEGSTSLGMAAMAFKLQEDMNSKVVFDTKALLSEIKDNFKGCDESKLCDGMKLLILFRREQAKNGRKGCLCVDCELDMHRAYTKFKENNK